MDRMMDHARSAMNVGADGHAYGANHMFHWTEADPMYQDYPGFWVFIGASIIGFWYWCTDQHIVQRVLGQRKGEDNDVVMKRARRGTIAAGYFKILPVFMFLIPGMVAAALAAKVNLICQIQMRLCCNGKGCSACRCKRYCNYRIHLRIGCFTGCFL